MGERFDDLSRHMARDVPRRGILKMVGGAFAAAAAGTVLRPFRGDAVTCPAGQRLCGGTCCDGTCASADFNCCCDPGLTPCGPACCNSGVRCLDAKVGTCGCPAGTTPCRPPNVVNFTCCPAGQACTNGCPPVSTFSTTAKKCCSDVNQTCNTLQRCCPGLTCVCVEGTCHCRLR